MLIMEISLQSSDSFLTNIIGHSSLLYVTVNKVFLKLSRDSFFFDDNHAVVWG